MVKFTIELVVLATSLGTNNIAHGVEESLVVGGANAADLREAGGEAIASDTMECLTPPSKENQMVSVILRCASRCLTRFWEIGRLTNCSRAS
jgi:hypothetical protein